MVGYIKKVSAFEICKNAVCLSNNNLINEEFAQKNLQYNPLDKFF
jgi:hypothetical protein